MSSSSQKKELQELPMDSKIINLAYGSHNDSILNNAKDLLAAATQHAVSIEPPSCPHLDYGPQLGSEWFRTTLAEFLSRRYHREVSSASLVLTCGATHALHLVTTQLFDTGSLVFVEDPSYYLALNLLRDDLRMHLVSVPMEEDGMALDQLEERLSALRAQTDFTPTQRQPFWSMVYVIPDHHNPTGVSMSPEKRRRLVDLARRYDLLVFCDDVYNLLTYSPSVVGPLLVTFDRPDDADFAGHVLSAGTFSKIFAPGVRVGWLEAPPRITQILHNSRIMSSGGAVNSWMSTVMASAIHLGVLDHHLDHIVSRLQANMCRLVTHLAASLPAGRYQLAQTPRGGFFAWLRCPFDTAPFVSWCLRERGVAAKPGHLFSASGDSCQRHLRLCASYLSAKQLEAALRLLCSAMLQYDAESRH